MGEKKYGDGRYHAQDKDPETGVWHTYTSSDDMRQLRRGIDGAIIMGKLGYFYRIKDTKTGKVLE